MNANLDYRDNVIYWTGIPVDKLSTAQLKQAFETLAMSQIWTERHRSVSSLGREWRFEVDNRKLPS